MIKLNEESENSSHRVWGRDVCKVSILFYFFLIMFKA